MRDSPLNLVYNFPEYEMGAILPRYDGIVALGTVSFQ